MATFATILVTLAVAQALLGFTTKHSAEAHQVKGPNDVNDLVELGGRAKFGGDCLEMVLQETTLFCKFYTRLIAEAKTLQEASCIRSEDLLEQETWKKRTENLTKQRSIPTNTFEVDVSLKLYYSFKEKKSREEFITWRSCLKVCGQLKAGRICERFLLLSDYFPWERNTRGKSLVKLYQRRPVTCLVSELRMRVVVFVEVLLATDDLNGTRNTKLNIAFDCYKNEQDYSYFGNVFGIKDVEECPQNDDEENKTMITFNGGDMENGYYCVERTISRKMCCSCKRYYAFPGNKAQYFYMLSSEGILTDRYMMKEESSMSRIDVLPVTIIEMCRIVCVLACGIHLLLKVQVEWPSTRSLIPDCLSSRNLMKMVNVSSEQVDDYGSSGDVKKWRRKGFDFWLDWNQSYTNLAAEIWSRGNYSVFPLECELDRVASFSGLHLPPGVSLMKLSRFGFYHTKEGNNVKCIGCASIVSIENIISQPSNYEYHASTSCKYATTGIVKEIGTACQRVEPATLTGNISAKTESQQEPKSEPEAEPEMKYENENAPLFHSGCVTTYIPRIPDVESLTAAPWECKGNDLPNLHSHQKPEVTKQRNETKQMTPFEWFDEKLIFQEANFGSECPKTKTHGELIPVADLRFDKIPSDMRHPDIRDLAEMVVERTVLITVSVMSLNRPKADRQKESGHSGSGSLFLDVVDRPERWLKELKEGGCLNPHQIESWYRDNAQSSTLNASSESSDRYFYCSVVTSTHVVFDQSEAMSSSIGVFYDPGEGHKTITLNGVAVRHSQVEGQYKSYLICKTREKSFVKWLYEARQKLITHINNMHPHTREILTQNCFVAFKREVNSQQLVSFGRCAVTKYGLVEKPDGRGKELVYLSNKESLSQTSDLREVLHYTAHTCPGSSGSVLLTFRRSAKDEFGRSNLDLAMWVHNGIEKSTGLGASVMKAVDPQFQHPDDEDYPKPLGALARKLRADSTAPRTGVPPLFPSYYSWEKRLASFKDHRYVSNCRHTPADLALGGFFYTGTSEDCVRCFYCGLGLKAWRPANDMYEEHQKNRSSCGFLKLCRDFKGKMNLDRLQEARPVAARPMASSLVVSLLEEENRLLNLRKYCRMCFRYDNKVLFLPCGEIVTCAACMELLSVCPSCDHKIEATAGVYLS